MIIDVAQPGFVDPNQFYLIFACFLLLFIGKEKKQDIFAGQSSGKQRKQGLKYIDTKNPKNASQILHTPKNTQIVYTPWNIPWIYFWCREWRMEPVGCVNLIFGLFLVNFTFGLFLAMHCLKMCLFCCIYEIAIYEAKICWIYFLVLSITWFSSLHNLHFFSGWNPHLPQRQVWQQHSKRLKVFEIFQ